MHKTITDGLFVHFLRCRRKAYLRVSGEAIPEEGAEYSRMQGALEAEYAVEAEARLIAGAKNGRACRSPSSLRAAIKQEYAIITNVKASVDGFRASFDALQRAKTGRRSYMSRRMGRSTTAAPSDQANGGSGRG